jgi:hypothetical protein
MDLAHCRPLAKAAGMSTVSEIESAILKLPPAEMKQVADWLENFLEDQLELRPEFAERLDRAQGQIDRGEIRTVHP